MASSAPKIFLTTSPERRNDAYDPPVPRRAGRTVARFLLRRKESPADAADPDQLGARPESISRAAGPGDAITIDVPVVPKELATTRVPALIGPTAIAYIKDVQWVESPDRLFQDLVQETVMRTTGRVVLDPRQASLDPGLHRYRHAQPLWL